MEPWRHCPTTAYVHLDWNGPMTRSLRRLLLSASAMVLLLSPPPLLAGDEPDGHCGFCDSVCYDDNEYGTLMCSQRCDATAIDHADCSWEPNPCSGSEPVWNVCAVRFDD